MPRKSKWPNVHKRTNRHGGVYYYHRPSSTRLRGEYESAEWLLHYKQLEQRSKPGPKNIKTGTVDHVIHHFQTTDERWLFPVYAKSTITSYSRAMEYIHEYIGSEFIEDITSEEIRAIIVTHAKIPSKQTGKPRLREAELIRQVFSIIWELASDSPTTFPQLNNKSNPAKKVKKRYKQGIGYRRWPEELVDVVINHLPAHVCGRVDTRNRRIPIKGQKIARLITHMYYTSQRCQDVIELERSQYVDPFLTYLQQKTDTLQHVYVHAELRAKFKEWFAEADVHFLNHKHNSMLIHTTEKGVKWTEDNARHRWIQLRKQIEQHPRLLEYKARNPHFNINDYSLHGLRKNATANLMEAVVEKEAAKAITGHTSDSMIDHYAKEMDQRVQSKNALERLEQKVT